ncbi:MAG: response regulator [Desulfuromonadales bacterium]|nr:response regulator [Desulfuromonadales bacterium]
MDNPIEQTPDLETPRARLPEEAAADLPLVGTEKMRILLVDDEPEIRELFAALLRRRGWEVVCAASAMEGLEALEENQFNLILMDIQMPEISGLDATRVIRRREQAGESPYTPIVAVTAWTLPEFRQACQAAGMDDFLAKPVTLSHLWSTVERNAKPAENQ